MELERSDGSEADVDTADDGLVTLTGAEAEQGLLEGQEGGGARRVDGVRGSLEVECVRDTVREHGSRAASECVSRHFGDILSQSFFHLRNTGSDVDSRSRSSQRLGIHSCRSDAKM